MSEALEAMLPFMKGDFGNPSSIHSWARKKLREIHAVLGISEEDMVNTLTDSLKRESVMQENSDADDR